MSLDFTLKAIQPTVVLDVNVTHNLTDMAEAAGLYTVMWRPQNVGKKASDLIPYLEQGIQKLKQDKANMRKLNPPNGWGSYEWLLEAAEKILDACRTYPDAEFHACV